MNVLLSKERNAFMTTSAYIHEYICIQIRTTGICWKSTQTTSVTNRPSVHCNHGYGKTFHNKPASKGLSNSIFLSHLLYKCCHFLPYIGIWCIYRCNTVFHNAKYTVFSHSFCHIWYVMPLCTISATVST